MIIPITSEQPFSVPARHTAAVETILLAKQILDSLTVPFFLSHGTLLGAIRDNDFIAHDSDIDLGIWDDCACAHRAIWEAFYSAGFRPAQEFGQEGYGHQYAFWSPTGVYLDLFFYADGDQHAYATIWKTPTEPRQQFFPPIKKFMPLDFCGQPFLVPWNFEEVLTSNYGPDWLTPVAPVERGGTWDWAESPCNYEATQ
jgi:hypothetical protein